MSSLLTLGLPKRRPRRSVQGRNLKKLGMSANHIIYYTWATSEVVRERPSDDRWGSLVRFFEELRRSSVLNANVGAVSRCTWVAMGGPWALLGSTWAPSWATAWPKCSVFWSFLSFLGHSWKLSGTLLGPSARLLKHLLRLLLSRVSLMTLTLKKRMKTRIDRCDWCGLLLDVNKVLVTPGKFFSAPKSKVRSGSKALFEVIVDS